MSFKFTIMLLSTCNVCLYYNAKLNKHVHTFGDGFHPPDG